MSLKLPDIDTQTHIYSCIEQMQMGHADMRRGEYCRAIGIEEKCLFMEVKCDNRSTAYALTIESSRAAWQVSFLEIMQMRFRLHFHMTDRLPNRQLECDGFSLAGIMLV